MTTSDQPVKVTVSNSDGAELVSISGVLLRDDILDDVRTVIVKDENGEAQWVQPGPDHQVDITPVD